MLSTKQNRKKMSAHEIGLMPTAKVSNQFTPQSFVILEIKNII